MWRSQLLCVFLTAEATIVRQPLQQPFSPHYPVHSLHKIQFRHSLFASAVGIIFSLFTHRPVEKTLQVQNLSLQCFKWCSLWSHPFLCWMWRVYHCDFSIWTSTLLLCCRYLAGGSAAPPFSSQPPLFPLDQVDSFIPCPPPNLSKLINRPRSPRERKASPSSLPGRLSRALSLGTIPSISRTGRVLDSVLGWRWLASDALSPVAVSEKFHWWEYPTHICLPSMLIAVQTCCGFHWKDCFWMDWFGR